MLYTKETTEKLSFPQIPLDLHTPPARVPLEKRLKNATRIVSTLVCASTALGTATLTLAHMNTRYQVRATVATSGSLRFQHEDKQTTDIVEYLSGYKPMSSADRNMLFKGLMLVRGKFVGFPIPKEVMSSPSFENTLQIVKNDKKFGLWLKLHGTDVQELIVGFNDLIPEQRRADPDMYRLIWKTLNQTGNPRLRWCIPGERTRLEVPHYDPLTNTVFLRAVPPYGFLSEVSHAKQIQEEPLNTYVQFGKSFSSILWNSCFRGFNLKAQQLDEYYSRNSPEYIAHKIIRPELEKPFMKFEMKSPLVKDL